jgi:hypothetical protein
VNLLGDFFLGLGGVDAGHAVLVEINELFGARLGAV